MMRKYSGALLAAFAASVAAQSATVVIQASSGGAGNDLTNTTITVPLNQRYTNPALEVVSTLFLTAAEGVPLGSITCTPHRYANLTGMAGLPFTAEKPSLLSTNTVQVGSLICESGEIVGSSSTTALSSTTSSSTMSSSTFVSSTSTSSTSTSSSSTSSSFTPSSSSSSSSTSSSSSSEQSSSLTPTLTTTSVVLTTVTASSSSEVVQSTEVVTATPTPAQGDDASQSTSASPSLNTPNAAIKANADSWRLRGAALAGAGLLAVF